MRCFFFLPLLLFSCQSETHTDNSSPQKELSVEEMKWETTARPDTPWVAVDTFTQADSIALRQEYAAIKARIRQRRSAFAQQYRAAANDSARQKTLQQASTYLRDAITTELLPPWYGTTWDFNGYTNHPREGLIACGYFVSTPLKHIDWPINRYRVAQQAASVIIDTLCEQQWTFRDAALALEHLGGLPDALYVVGLSNHVGFLLVEKGEVFFIHASYVSPGVALREKAAESTVFLYSDIYVIGSLLSPNGMLRDWVRAG